MTQYEAILNHLRKHRVATVRDLLKFTNYPSARIFEMTTGRGHVTVSAKYDGDSCRPVERITRSWVQRNGKRVRLYSLVRA